MQQFPEIVVLAVRMPKKITSAQVSKPKVQILRLDILSKSRPSIFIVGF